MNDDPTFAETFSKNIRQAMAQRGWTQRRLGDESGLHWQTIHRILSGQIRPSLSTCEKIAKALDMPREKVLQLPTDTG